MNKTEKKKNPQTVHIFTHPIQAKNGDFDIIGWHFPLVYLVARLYNTH